MRVGEDGPGYCAVFILVRQLGRVASGDSSLGGSALCPVRSRSSHIRPRSLSSFNSIVRHDVYLGDSSIS